MSVVSKTPLAMLLKWVFIPQSAMEKPRVLKNGSLAIASNP